MQVRSAPAFAASIAMLVAAASLGMILAHDGEVGTDEAKLPYAAEGDHVALKGELEPFAVPRTTAWHDVAALLEGPTYLLADQPVTVLITGIEGDVPDEAVVEGAVLYHGDHPDGGILLVLDATRVDEPFFDWA